MNAGAVCVVRLRAGWLGAACDGARATGTAIWWRGVGWRFERATDRAAYHHG